MTEITTYIMAQLQLNRPVEDLERCLCDHISLEALERFPAVLIKARQAGVRIATADADLLLIVKRVIMAETAGPYENRCRIKKSLRAFELAIDALIRKEYGFPQAIEHNKRQILSELLKVPKQDMDKGLVPLLANHRASAAHIYVRKRAGGGPRAGAPEAPTRPTVYTRNA